MNSSHLVVRLVCVFVASFVTNTHSQSAEYGQVFGVGYNAKHSNGDCPNLDKVVSDFRFLRQITSRVRTFGLADCDQGKLLVQAAQQTGMKVSLGMFINQYEAEYTRELERLQDIVQNYPHTLPSIEYIIVGSEAYYRNETTFDQLGNYVQRTRQFLNSKNIYNIPLTIADVKDSWYSDTAMTKAVDAMFVNAYPYWEGITIENAVDHLFNKIYEVRQRIPNKKFILGETGWPEGGQNFKASIPSLQNQIKYFHQFICRAKRENIDYYWFSAFDESWKTNEAKSNWGLFTEGYRLKNGYPKPLDSGC